MRLSDDLLHLRGQRCRSADEVTDVHRGLAPGDIHVLSVVLIAAPLAELAEWHDVSAEQVQRLTAIDRPTGDRSQDEYLSYLLDEESA
jgi:hypothetical protein